MLKLGSVHYISLYIPKNPDPSPPKKIPNIRRIDIVEYVIPSKKKVIGLDPANPGFLGHTNGSLGLLVRDYQPW